jgi:hypothetical protein
MSIKGKVFWVLSLPQYVSQMLVSELRAKLFTHSLQWSLCWGFSKVTFHCCEKQCIYLQVQM